MGKLNSHICWNCAHGTDEACGTFCVKLPPETQEPPEERLWRRGITGIREYEASVSNGLATLKPGITLTDLVEAFHTPILEAGLKTIRPAFHGLGLTSEEPLSSTAPGTSCIPSDSFTVQERMVFEFEPHIITQDMKKGLTLGYPVLVTEDGCRLLCKNKPEVKIIR